LRASLTIAVGGRSLRWQAHDVPAFSPGDSAMSKTAITMFALALVSTPALAQYGGDLRSGSPRFPLYLYNSMGSSHQNPATLKDDRQCLVRKSNGRTECRTMAEWRRIARDLETKADRAKE
jgi:hypothetical protein